MPPPLIQLTDIALTFGGTPLLEGVELSVSAGERVCLVGRNGSGKSTLLKIVAGLVEPDSGERFIQPGAAVRYLPQEPDLSGFATTLAYVESGLGPTDDPHQARYLLEQLGLTGDEDPAHLSGGEARRAALAHVLAPDPDILLLDEPTNHLDLPAIEWLEARLVAAARRAGADLATTGASWKTSRASRSGSTAARPAASTSASARSRPGATRSWKRKRSPSTSSTARSRAKSTGCATA